MRLRASDGRYPNSYLLFGALIVFSGSFYENIFLSTKTAYFLDYVVLRYSEMKYLKFFLKSFQKQEKYRALNPVYSRALRERGAQGADSYGILARKGYPKRR